jgi:hypothetical protein
MGYRSVKCCLKNDENTIMENDKNTIFLREKKIILVVNIKGAYFWKKKCSSF